MTRTMWPSLLALALVAAASLAGAEDPGMLTIEDASLDPMPPAASAYADIVSARLQLVDETLVAAIDLALLPEVQPGIAYVFVFSAGPRAYYVALASAPEAFFTYGTWEDQGPGTMLDGKGSYTTGPGATITMEMPLSAVGNATVLTSPLAYTVDIKGSVLPVGLPIAFLVLDDAAGEGEIVVRAPSAEPATGGTSTSAAVEESVEAAPAGAATTDPAQDKTVPAPPALLVIAALGLVALARRR